MTKKITQVFNNNFVFEDTDPFQVGALAKVQNHVKNYLKTKFNFIKNQFFINL
jgi:hypothetical protein